MKTYRQFILESTSFIKVDKIRADFERVLSKYETAEGSPGEFAKLLRPIAKKYLSGVSFKKVPDLDPGDISVWGAYDPDLDKTYVKDKGTDLPIELILLFSSKDKKMALTLEGIKYFARYLSETLAHEWIHLRQARARKWKDNKTKEFYIHKIENKEVGSYLADDDEIEAHAFNIAGSLMDTFKNKQKALEFLRKPSSKTLSDHHFDLYVKTFGFDHTVTKRLIKKIVTYIEKR